MTSSHCPQRMKRARPRRGLTLLRRLNGEDEEKRGTVEVLRLIIRLREHSCFRLIFAAREGTETRGRIRRLVGDVPN